MADKAADNKKGGFNDLGKSRSDFDLMFFLERMFEVLIPPYFAGMCLSAGKMRVFKKTDLQKEKRYGFIIRCYKRCKYFMLFLCLLFLIYTVKHRKCSQIRRLYFVPMGIFHSQ
jgi:hypothetical protein